MTEPCSHLEYRILFMQQSVTENLPRKTVPDSMHNLSTNLLQNSAAQTHSSDFANGKCIKIRIFNSI